MSWNDYLICLKEFPFYQCPKIFPTHTWYLFGFLTTLGMNGIIHSASIDSKQAHGLHRCACLIAQSFLSGILYSQVSIFKIKYKDFLEGYSVKKERKNIRSSSTDTRRNLKCSRFTRISPRSFWVTISTAPFPFPILFFLSSFFCRGLHILPWKSYVNQFPSNFKFSWNVSACNIPLQKLYSGAQTASSYLNIKSRNFGIKVKKALFLSIYIYFLELQKGNLCMHILLMNKFLIF